MHWRVDISLNNISNSEWSHLFKQISILTFSFSLGKKSTKNIHENNVLYDT